MNANLARWRDVACPKCKRGVGVACVTTRAWGKLSAGARLHGTHPQRKKLSEKSRPQTGATTMTMSNRKTIIHYNGSGSTRSIEALLERLETNTLDPSFEERGGDFASNVRKGVVHFHGNFYDYSHAFSVETSDPALCATLFAAIKKNKSTSAYIRARAERRERERQRVSAANFKSGKGKR